MHIFPPVAEAAYRKSAPGGIERSYRLTAVSDELIIRTMDLVVAGLLLVFLAPLMLVITVAIRLSDGGPAFYVHRRLGRSGQSFPCLKFRTMAVDADRQLHQLLATDPDAREEWTREFKLRRDPRITRLGAFLRQTSIDELPQFINVLRGEMSIVGPRPIVEQEIERYGRYFDHYSAVKPGITGLWQLGARGDPSYRRRIALDVSYARNKSVGLDVRILAMTLPAMLLAS